MLCRILTGEVVGPPLQERARPQQPQREQLLQRMGTQLVIRQQEVVEARLAELEVGKDVADVNAMELEVSQQTWDLGKTGKVRRLYEQAEHDPLASPILMTNSQSLVKGVEAEIEKQLSGLERRDIATAALSNRSDDSSSDQVSSPYLAA